MSGFGHYALFASHALALWGAAAALVAFTSRDERFLKSAVRSIYAITVLVSMASGALVVAFLVGDDASYMTGQVLLVDGGLSLGTY